MLAAILFGLDYLRKKPLDGQNQLDVVQDVSDESDNDVTGDNCRRNSTSSLSKPRMFVRRYSHSSMEGSNASSVGRSRPTKPRQRYNSLTISDLQYSPTSRSRRYSYGSKTELTANGHLSASGGLLLSDEQGDNVGKIAAASDVEFVGHRRRYRRSYSCCEDTDQLSVNIRDGALLNKGLREKDERTAVCNGGIKGLAVKAPGGYEVENGSKELVVSEQTDIQQNVDWEVRVDGMSDAENAKLHLSEENLTPNCVGSNGEVCRETAMLHDEEVIEVSECVNTTEYGQPDSSTDTVDGVEEQEICVIVSAVQCQQLPGTASIQYSVELPVVVCNGEPERVMTNGEEVVKKAVQPDIELVERDQEKDRIGSDMLTESQAINGAIDLDSRVGETIETYSSKQDIIPLTTTTTLCNGHTDSMQHDSTVTKLTKLDTAGSCVFGIAHLQGHLFVACRELDTLLVYRDQQPFHRQTSGLRVPGMTDPWDIASCSTNNCLYVTDLKGQCVWNVKVTPVNEENGVASIRAREVECWFKGIDRPWTLSVTPDANVIIVTGTGSVVVVSPDGNQLHTIQLPSDIRTPLHAIQLSTGNYLVTHGLLDGRHQVCQFSLTSAGSTVVHTFGSGTPETENLREPWHIVLLAERILCVADSRNGRLVLLDDKLHHLQTVDTTPQVGGATRCGGLGRSRPWRLTYIPQSQLLLVGFYAGGIGVYNIMQTGS